MRDKSTAAGHLLGVAAALSLLLAACWIAGGARNARADDDRAGARFFQEEFTRIGAECGERVFELVTKAREQHLYAFAVDETYRLLLDFDPDHTEARENLGFAKKSGDWVLAEEKAHLVDSQNRRDQSETQTQFDRRVSDWRAERAKTYRAVAEKLVELGRTCAEKGYASQARRAYARALAIDPGRADAHVALGHVRVGDLWLSSDDMKAFESASGGMPVAEKTPLESELGAELQKTQSRHFRFQLDSGDTDLPAAARIAEATYMCFVADFGIDPKSDPFVGERARIAVVGTSEAWRSWVGLFAREADREAAEAAGSYCNPDSLTAGALCADTAESPDPLDALLVHAARLLGERTFRLEGVPWIDRGLAAYYAMKIRGRTRLIGVPPDPAMPIASSSENWHPYLDGLVRQRKDDDLRKIAAARGEALDVASSVKSWAVVTWLMDTDRPKFVAFLRAMEGGAAKPDEVALRVYGKNLFGLDKAWRAYAQQNY